MALLAVCQIPHRPMLYCCEPWTSLHPLGTSVWLTVLYFTRLQSSAVPVAEEAINVDEIPIETLDLNIELEMPKGLDGLASSDKYYREAMLADKQKKKEKR